jgi:hypothetical protein
MIVLTPWNFSVVGNHKDDFPLSLLTKEMTREGMGLTITITGSGKYFLRTLGREIFRRKINPLTRPYRNTSPWASQLEHTHWLIDAQQVSKPTIIDPLGSITQALCSDLSKQAGLIVEGKGSLVNLFLIQKYTSGPLSRLLSHSS